MLKLLKLFRNNPKREESIFTTSPGKKFFELSNEKELGKIGMPLKQEDEEINLLNDFFITNIDLMLAAAKNIIEKLDETELLYKKDMFIFEVNFNSDPSFYFSGPHIKISIKDNIGQLPILLLFDSPIKVIKLTGNQILLNEVKKVIEQIKTSLEMEIEKEQIEKEQIDKKSKQEQLEKYFEDKMKEKNQII